MQRPDNDIYIIKKSFFEKLKFFLVFRNICRVCD